MNIFSGIITNAHPFFLIILAVFYLFPSIVAGFRFHNNTMPILVINFFLGWTGLFWVLSLAWALYNDRNIIVAVPKDKPSDEQS